MSIPNSAEAPVLRSDAEVLERVRQLIGTASHPRQLWVMWLDGDGRQAPVVVPISDVPPDADAEMLRGLGEVLNGLRSELHTDAGDGSVIFALERIGEDLTLAMDRRWAAALRDICDQVGVAVRGVFLSTDSRVVPL